MITRRPQRPRDQNSCETGECEGEEEAFVRAIIIAMILLLTTSVASAAAPAPTAAQALSRARAAEVAIGNAMTCWTNAKDSLNRAIAGKASRSELRKLQAEALRTETDLLSLRREFDALRDKIEKDFGVCSGLDANGKSQCWHDILGVDVVGIEAATRVMQGTFLQTRTTEEAAGTRTVSENFGQLQSWTLDDDGNPVPVPAAGSSVFFERKSYGGITRFGTPPVAASSVPMPNFQRVSSASSSDGWEWFGAVAGGAAGGAAIGCGIGGAVQPSVLDEGGFSSSDCGYGALIGVGAGAGIGAIIKAIVD